MEQCRQKLEAILNEATRRAYEIVGRPEGAKRPDWAKRPEGGKRG